MSWAAAWQRPGRRRWACGPARPRLWAAHGFPAPQRPRGVHAARPCCCQDQAARLSGRCALQMCLGQWCVPGAKSWTVALPYIGAACIETALWPYGRQLAASACPSAPLPPQENFQRGLPGIEAWQTQVVKACREQGYVEVRPRAAGCAGLMRGSRVVRAAAQLPGLPLQSKLLTILLRCLPAPHTASRPWPGAAATCPTSTPRTAPSAPPPSARPRTRSARWGIGCGGGGGESCRGPCAAHASSEWQQASSPLPLTLPSTACLGSPSQASAAEAQRRNGRSRPALPSD